MSGQYYERDIGLDILRGLTICLMLIVNNAGDFKTVWPVLQHAPWHGFLGADIVFPLFLFIAGFSARISLKKQILEKPPNHILRKIIFRGVILFSLGIFLNGWPFSWLPGSQFSISHWRIGGVLQRIALCYIAGSLLLWKAPSVKGQVFIIVMLIGVYEYCMRIPLWEMQGVKFGQSFSLEQNFARLTDIRVLPKENIYRINGIPFDPEGLFSTIMATATFLLGALFAEKYTRKWLLISLAGMTAIFLFIEPINKNLWTGTFVFFTAGVSALLYLAVQFLVEKNKGSFLQIFSAVGKNSLSIYVLTTMLARALAYSKLESGISVKQYLYSVLFSSWFWPEWASFMYSCVILGIGILIGQLLFLRGYVIKV